MLKYLVPYFPLRDVPALLGFILLGSLIAGAYGVIHDQVTYSIGPSYFTNFKFDQFRWADNGLGDRGFVACIGFLATWWVGMISGWILARRMLPNHSRKVATRKILLGIAIIFSVTLLFGLLGFIYGVYRGPNGDYSGWAGNFKMLEIAKIDRWSFVRVAYIHNAGYLGGLVGLVLTFFVLRPGKEDAPEGGLSTSN